MDGNWHLHEILAFRPPSCLQLLGKPSVVHDIRSLYRRERRPANLRAGKRNWSSDLAQGHEGHRGSWNSASLRSGTFSSPLPIFTPAVLPAFLSKWPVPSPLAQVFPRVCADVRDPPPSGWVPEDQVRADPGRRVPLNSLLPSLLGGPFNDRSAMSPPPLKASSAALASSAQRLETGPED